MADDTRWSDARQDYITSSLSYRQIAEKHKLPKTTLYARAKKERWVEKREQYRSKAEAKKQDVSIDAEVKRYEKLVSVSNVALERIEQMLQKPDIDERGVRALMASLKDIKDIQGLRSTADAREQDARIANLERQANADEKTNDGVVIEIDGLPEAWRE